MSWTEAIAGGCFGAAIGFSVASDDTTTAILIFVLAYVLLRLNQEFERMERKRERDQ